MNSARVTITNCLSDLTHYYWYSLAVHAGLSAVTAAIAAVAVVFRVSRLVAANTIDPSGYISLLYKQCLIAVGPRVQHSNSVPTG